MGGERGRSGGNVSLDDSDELRTKEVVMENTGMKKILIVDDEHDFVQVLRERLEFEGYQTVIAYEGVRAIELANREKPDLLILDLQMPAGTGQSVLHAIRTHSSMDKIPVIIMTGLSGENLERELLAAGAQDFMRKPCDPHKLLARIETVLGGSPG